MYFEGVIRDKDDVKICFSGLPKTIEMLKNKIAQTSLSGFFLMKSFQDLQVCPAEVSGLQLCR